MVACALAGSALSACSPNPNGGGLDASGTVIGNLVDAASNAPIGNALLSIGGQAVTIGPGANGGFVIGHVPIGPQTLRITVTGYSVVGGSGVSSIDVNVLTGSAGPTNVGNIRMQSVGGPQALPTASPSH